MGYPKLVKDVPDCFVLVNTFEDTFGDIYSGGVWSEFCETASSNISQNVVSLASFYGEKRIFACTGSFIEWNGCTTILTSASLVSHFVGDKKIADFKIKVLLPNKEHRGGALQHYNIALVNVEDFTAPHPVNIQPQRSNYSTELVAVGCCFKSGTLMAARGQHTAMLHKLDCKLVKYSTCKITKAGIGGPLVDSDGKFIGMNFCGIDLYAMNLHDVKRTWTPFLSSDVILDVLAYFKTKRTVAEVGLDGYASGGLDWVIDGDSSVRPNSWPVPKANLYPRRFVDLEAPPKPKKRIRVHNPVVRIIDGKKYWFM
ncbi:unnamed protein product [Urochloa humidicola]